MGATSLLHSELLEKLNDDNDPLVNRIEFAYKIFTVKNLPLTRKEDLVISWILSCIQCESFKEKNELFILLQKCLNCPQLQLDIVEIRSAVCIEICEVLCTWGLHSNCCPKEVIQKCIILVVENPIFFECFKQDVLAFSKLITAYFKSIDESNSADDCAIVVKKLIDLHCHTLLKTDLRVEFSGKILAQIVKTFITIGEYDTQFEKELYKAICEILFSNSKYIPGLELTEVKNECDSGDVFVITLKKLPDKFSVEVVEYLYPKFLNSFITNVNDQHRSFGLFVSLCAIIGVKPIEDCVNKSIKSVKNFDGSVTFLNMIKTMNDLSISPDTEIEGLSENVTLSSWLITLLQTYAKEERQLTPELVKIIREVILFLDPVMAENMLAYFARFVMTMKKDSEILCRVFCNTLIDIFDIFIKLSRVHKFVSKIVDELEECLMDKRDTELTLEQIFPEKFCKKYGDTIVSQPTVTCFHILTISQFYLEKFLKSMADMPQSGLDNNGCILLIEIIFELTSWVLRGAWVMESSIPIAVREKFIFVLEDIAKFLTSFGNILVNNKFNERATKSYLDLCFSWGAVSLLITQYCFDQGDLVNEQANINATNLAFVLPFLSDRSWDVLANRVVQFGGQKLKHSLYALMEQKISALSSIESGVDGSGGLTARFLLENADPEWLCEHSNSVIYFLDVKDLLNLCTRILEESSYCKTVSLITSREFLGNYQVVAAMGLTILSMIARKCKKMKRPLLKRVLSKMELNFILEDESGNVISDDVDDNISEMALLLAEGKGIDNEETTVEFQIMSYIEKNLELLSLLPLTSLTVQTQSVFLLALLATAKCLPYNSALYEIIHNIVDKPLPLPIPKTVNWFALLKWIVESSKTYPNNETFLKCFVKMAFRDSSCIQEIVKSICVADNEVSLVLGTAVCSVLSKVKRKRDIDGNVIECCKEELYQCLRKVTYVKPSNIWIPTFQLALHQQLTEKRADSNKNLDKEIISLVPQYIKIALDRVQEAESDNLEVDDIEEENNNESPLKKEGEFIRMVLENRGLLQSNFPDNIVSISWASLVGQFTIPQVQFFLQAASFNEFKVALNTLKELTTQLLTDRTVEKKVCILWQVLALSQLSYEKQNVRNELIDHLSTVFLQLAFEWKKTGDVYNVHNALSTILKAKQIKITVQHVEMCLEVISATPKDTSAKILKNSVEVLSNLLRFRTAIMLDLIPQFLQRFVYLISVLSAASHLPSIQHSVIDLADVAFSIEKLTSEILKSSKYFGRVVHMTIVDILNLFEQYTIESSVKMHLQDSVYFLLSIIDSHAKGYIMRSIPRGSGEIFKKINNDYLKYYKFNGKV